MRRLVAVVALVALLLAAAGTASHAPTRANAIAELREAIEEEKKALQLLQRTPPRVNGAAVQLDRSATRLRGVADYASSAGLGYGVEYGSLDRGVHGLREIGHHDRMRADQLTDPDDPPREYLPEIVRTEIERNLRLKQAILTKIQAAVEPKGTPQCSDAKDNDRDGLVDSNVDPGCTSGADRAESSPFHCDLDSRTVGTQIVISGACSGPFAGLEFQFLDGVQLNGRYSVMHAPSCPYTELQEVRCTAKEGDRNPHHLVEARFTTTAAPRRPRLAIEFLDRKKRQIGRSVVPPRPSR